MATDYLYELCDYYREKATKEALKRRKYVIPLLEPDGSIPEVKGGGIKYIMATIRKDGFDGPLNPYMISDDSKLYRPPLRYLQDEAFRAEIDLDLETKPPDEVFGKKDLGLRIFRQCNPCIKTQEQADAEIAETKMQHLLQSDPGYDIEVHTSETQVPNNGPVGIPRPQSRASIIRQKFGRIINDLGALARIGEELYYRIDDLTEVVVDSQGRIKAGEEKTSLLQQRFASQQAQINELQTQVSELVDAFTSNHPSLTVTQQKVEALTSILAGLPTSTQGGGYWKEELPTVYRKGFKTFLTDKGTQLQERAHVIDTANQIVIDPFIGLKKTEIRRNGRDGQTIAGLPVGADYFYSYASPWIRVLYAVIDKRLHFIEAGRKKEYE